MKWSIVTTVSNYNYILVVSNHSVASVRFPQQSGRFLNGEAFVGIKVNFRSSVINF